MRSQLGAVMRGGESENDSGCFGGCFVLLAHLHVCARSPTAKLAPIRDSFARCP